MKKLIMMTVLVAGGTAGAQAIQFSGGGAFTTGALGLNFGITAQSLGNVNGIDIDGRLSADISAVSGNFVNADVLFNFPMDTFDLYTGLGASFALSGVNNASIFGTATIGVNVPLFNEVGVFTEAVLRYNGSSLNRSTIRAGLNYTF